MSEVLDRLESESGRALVRYIGRSVPRPESVFVNTLGRPRFPALRGGTPCCILGLLPCMRYGAPQNFAAVLSLEDLPEDAHYLQMDSEEIAVVLEWFDNLSLEEAQQLMDELWGVAT